MRGLRAVVVGAALLAACDGGSEPDARPASTFDAGADGGAIDGGDSPDGGGGAIDAGAPTATLSIRLTAAGEVRSSDGAIVCTASPCDVSLPAGTVVTLTAT